MYEQQAAEYLKAQGYQILAYNYRTYFGEIDLIVEKEALLVFVEVKYRKNTSKGYPQEAISRQKQQKIFQSAKAYLYRNGLLHRDCRFDVIAILGDEVEHIKNAFQG